MRARIYIILGIMLTLLSTGVGVIAQEDASHCMIEAQLFEGDFDPENPPAPNRESTPSVMTCFNSPQELVSHITNGAVELPDNATQAQIYTAIREHNRNLDISRASTLDSGGVVAFNTYVLAILYDWANWNSAGGYLYVTASYNCLAGNFAVYDIGGTYSGWDNRVESANLESNCDVGYWYEHNNLGGDWSYCLEPCYGIGSVANKMSSFVLTD
jgi:hypothetical protein